jgi:hypothetical protein
MSEIGDKRPLDATGRREVKIGASAGHSLDTIHFLHYDLEEFISAYRLTPLEGRKIFMEIGPRRDDLDLHMTMKSNDGTLQRRED